MRTMAVQYSGLVRSQVAASCRSLMLYYNVQGLRAFFGDADHSLEVVQRYHKFLRDLEVSFRARLDSNYVITPTSAELAFLEEVRSYKRMVLSRPSPDQSPLKVALYNHYKERALSARKEEQVSRLVWELMEADLCGWYPVFVTLTVSPEHYDTVFDRSSNCFRDYIRTVTRRIGRQLGLTKSESDARSCDIHRYLAVVERGGKTGRLHVHVVHLCKRLPFVASDPNAGRDVPDRRELSGWRVLWNYGFVTACPVRTGARDVYARDGWRWPVVKADDGRWQPYKATGMLGVARYVGKYLVKQRYGRKEYWRCRMTRKFGLREIDRVMRSMTTKELWMMLKSVMPRVKRYGRVIPSSLLRKRAMKEVCRRYPKTVVRLWRDLAPAPSLVCQMATGYLLTRGLRQRDGSECLTREFARAARKASVSGPITEAWN